MKKFLFIGMAAILGASLSFFACESATGDAGAAGSPGSAVVTGDLSATALQVLVDRGNPILIADDAEIGAGYVDLKGASITVEAALTFASGAIVNARSANIAIGSGSIVTDNGTIITPTGTSVWNSAGAGVSGTGTLAPVVSLTEFAAATGSGSYALESVSVGSDGKVGGELVATAVDTKTVYIFGELTNASAALDLSTLTGVKPLGSISSSANIKLGATTLKGGLTVSGTATLTTGAGAVVVGGALSTGTGAVSLGGALTVGGNAVIGGALVTTAQVTVTFDGATASVASYTTKADASADTFAGTAALTIATLNDLATDASTVTFNGPTTITNAVTPGTNGLTIAGTGAVTLSAALGATATNNLLVKSTGGVTLTAENTIAANVKATKATIKSNGTNGATIDSDAVLTVPTGGSIAVTASGASIVAGGTTNNVTITGATLKTGAYTGTDGKLSLSTTAEIEVANGGSIAIAGSGNLELTVATSKVVLLAGGKLDVKAAAGKFGDTAQTDTKVTVATSSATTATKATVANTGTAWTVTTLATSGSGTVTDVILGDIKFAFTDTAINALAGADPDGAAGSITAGTGTTITFIGSA